MVEIHAVAQDLPVEVEALQADVGDLDSISKDDRAVRVVLYDRLISGEGRGACPLHADAAHCEGSGGGEVNTGYVCVVEATADIGSGQQGALHRHVGHVGPVEDDLLGRDIDPGRPGKVGIGPVGFVQVHREERAAGEVCTREVGVRRHAAATAAATRPLWATGTLRSTRPLGSTGALRSGRSLRPGGAGRGWLGLDRVDGRHQIGGRGDAQDSAPVRAATLGREREHLGFGIHADGLTVGPVLLSARHSRSVGEVGHGQHGQRHSH